MGELSSSPPSYPWINGISSSVGQPGNKQSHPQSSNSICPSHWLLPGAVFLLFWFPSAIISFTFTCNLVSISLSFWEWMHWTPALWGLRSLHGRDSDSWENVGKGREEVILPGRWRGSVPPSESFCYLHWSTVLPIPLFIWETVTWIRLNHCGALCQPTTKIYDGFLKVGWVMKACF